MKNSGFNLTYFRRVFAVIIATTFFSTLSQAVPQPNNSTAFSKSFAKSNPVKLRKSSKQQSNHVGGVYQTSAQIQNVTDKLQSLEPAKNNQPLRLRANDIENLKSSPSASTNDFGFDIFDATVYLNRDLDNDGFYSEFDLEMDVDIDTGSANVYAEIYYLNSNGDWQWLNTTDVFSITGNLASDSFITTISLVNGFSDNYYDLLIDVYEDGIPEIVATLQSSDDPDLELVPLEDLNFDLNSNVNALVMNDLSFSIFDDFDFDGFYTSFDFEISLDNETYGRNLQAVLYSRDSESNWSVETSTAAVFANRGDSVIFRINGDWNTGYFPDYYDFLVEIVDLDTAEIVDDFGPEYNALFERPLESADYDNPEDTVIIVEESYSSGSSGVFFLLLLTLAYISRRNLNRVTVENS